MAARGHRGVFYDGITATRRPADLRIEADALVIVPEGTAPVRWPLSGLRAQRGRGGGTRSFREIGSGTARLVVDAPETITALEAAAPRLHHIALDRTALGRVFLWSGSAIAAVAVLLFVLLPALANRLATWIPPEREAALGRIVIEQVAGMFGSDGDTPRFCTGNPDGLAALDRMMDRLTAADRLPYPIDVRVIDAPAINAFAAPGGQMGLLRGLLDAARTPDEVAGVMAHELGHVAARDPTRLMLRAAGSAGLVGLLFGDLTGGAAIVAVTNQLLQSAYSREAEAAADAYAVSLLDEAGVSSAGLADFFDRLARENSGGPVALSYFRSHPDTAVRAVAVRAADPHPDAPPILDDSAWAALQAVCD